MEEKRLYFYLAYIAFFLLCIVFSTLINGLFLKFSKTLGIRQTENYNIVRWASTAKPSVGGFSFYIVFLVSVSIFAIFNFSQNPFLNTQLIGLLLSCSLGFLIGLADDAYNTNPLLKFIGQLMCAIILISSDIIINISDFFSLNALFTIFWVVGIMNAINILDNMDGVTATISAIILFTCLSVIAVEDKAFNIYGFIIMGTIGAIAGFMVYNFSPAKIYMGDTGSQFLGILLAGVSIVWLWNFRDVPGPPIQFKQILLPLLVFTAPVIDTTTVFARRMLRKQSPFVGGKDHTTHHLAYCGLSDRQVLYVIAAVSILSGAISFLFIYFYSEITSLITLLGYIYLITLFIIMQYFYEIGEKKRLKKANQESAIKKVV